MSTSGAFISKRQVESAVLDVRGELAALGLWNGASRLRSAEVFWCALPQLISPRALGFFTHAIWRWAAALGYAPGHIYIPSFVFGVGTRSLRNVVRHEYGHAVAHYYPALIQRSRRFTAIFGGRYARGTPAPGASVRSGDFITPYAASEPAEDFCETFMVFVRRGGQPPARSSPAVRRKFSFVAEIAATIDAMSFPAVEMDTFFALPPAGDPSVHRRATARRGAAPRPRRSATRRAAIV